MELPITVMIVLFVSIVVGGVVIMFSQNVLTNAENSIPNLDDDDLQDKIVEVPSVSLEMVEALSAQCAQDNRQSLDEVLCVVLNSDTDMALGSEPFPGHEFIEDGDYRDGKSTLFIYYYGHSNTVVLKS